MSFLFKFKNKMRNKRDIIEYINEFRETSPETLSTLILKKYNILVSPKTIREYQKETYRRTYEQSSRTIEYYQHSGAISFIFNVCPLL
jgi:hypothetical protein